MQLLTLLCVRQGETVTVDTSKLAVHKKYVRPISLQETMESRRLWHHVTESLCSDDIDRATEHKRIVSCHHCGSWMPLCVYFHLH